uniref:DDE_3 domain-containing protein n=1 Tax=Strongyloides papillosus TaxID=174720 RepID=A0A0N5C1S0_STREA
MKAEIVMLFAKIDEAKEEVAAVLKSNLKTSVRRLSSITGSSISTMWRALKAMKFHPYRMLRVQKLETRDYEKSRKFCMEELKSIEENSCHLMNWMFSDEAHFHLDGGVNRHTFRMWSNENPKWVEKQALHSPRNHRSLLFEGNLTRDFYISLLQTQFWPEISNNGISERIVFMQDGSPPHYTKKVREWLDSNFQGRWIGRGSRSLVWPPRSPDLTPMDYFFWGYVKSLAYREKSTTLEELKEKIREAFEKVNDDKEMLERTFQNYERRLKMCLMKNSGHFENVVKNIF